MREADDTRRKMVKLQKNFEFNTDDIEKRQHALQKEKEEYDAKIQ
jgi:hypothetical protein